MHLCTDAFDLRAEVVCLRIVRISWEKEKPIAGDVFCFTDEGKRTFALFMRIVEVSSAKQRYFIY